MIRQIKIDGFKSLSNFDIELNPGLNILVGPNGSGKSNIISFFEFLVFLVEMNISGAISSAGGAGAVLTKVGENRWKSDMDATIIGTIRIGNKEYVYYKYTFSILVLSGETAIYSTQRLQFKYRTVNSIDEKRIGQFDFDVEKTTTSNLQSKVKIRELNHERLRTFRFSKIGRSRSEHETRISQTLTEFLGPDESIFKGLSTSMTFGPDVRYIYRDIHSGNVYNIEPSRAIIPQDIAQKPGMHKDGSGLYSTLYAMKKAKNPQRNRWPRAYFPGSFQDNLLDNDTATIDDVFKYLKLTNEAIATIDVVNDPFDNQLQVKVGIKGKKRSCVLPLSVMSHGTVKWLCLITIILTNRSWFSIEEPENYIHPLMQCEVLSIMRSFATWGRFILLSTHSETLLNNAQPTEIILVSFGDGRTKAHRISNAEEISTEIINTGFGLGYYYIAGSLENE